MADWFAIDACGRVGAFQGGAIPEAAVRPAAAWEALEHWLLGLEASSGYEMVSTLEQQFELMLHRGARFPKHYRSSVQVLSEGFERVHREMPLRGVYQFVAAPTPAGNTSESYELIAKPTLPRDVQTLPHALRLAVIGVNLTTCDFARDATVSIAGIRPRPYNPHVV